MRSKFYLIAVTALVACFTLALAKIHAGPPPVTIDQQQPTIDYLTVGGLGIGGGSEQVLAQVFTAGINGLLTEVQLPVVCNSGNLIVEIHGVTEDGLPDNRPPLTSQTFDNLPDFYPNPPSFRSLAFSTPVRGMRAGHQYAVVLKASGSCAIFQGPEGDPYASGKAYYISLPNPPDLWVPLGGRDDLPFKTLGLGGGRP